jgi:hypothetical protein
MWGGYFFFKNNSRVRVFENKKFKESLGSFRNPTNALHKNKYLPRIGKNQRLPYQRVTLVIQ